MLLRERRASFDALVDALREGRSVGECVWAIEAAGPSLELRPATVPIDGESG